MKKFLQGRLASFNPAFDGFKHVWRTQPNIWLHALISAGVILVGLWVGLNTTDWALIGLAMALVWVTEFVNSAVEAAIDLASPGEHRLAKIAKDVSAAAVVLAALAAVLLGFLVLWRPMWERVFGG
ncbi:MAG: diacylglycerol kinase family protein [Anaerolineales bacterium]